MARGGPNFKDFAKALNGITQQDKITAAPKLIVAYGPSDYLLQKCAVALKDRWLKEPNSHYSASEAQKLDNDGFSLFWESQSMFEPTPFYLIRRVEKKADFWKMLQAIPRPEAIKNHICLTIQGNSPVAKLNKELERLKAYRIPCFEPAEYELERFIGGLAAKHGLNLNDSAVKILHDSQGNNLFKLENEIVKLRMIFDNSATKLSADDLAPYLGMVREDHVFKLDNLLIAGKATQAQALIIDLLRRGEKALAILGILASHCRKAGRVASAIQQGQNERDIATTLRLPSHVVRSYISYVTRTNPARFTAALSQCRQADLYLKSSQMADELILSEVLVTLTGE